MINIDIKSLSFMRLSSNRFQKKLTVQNTNIWIFPPHLSHFLNHWRWLNSSHCDYYIPVTIWSSSLNQAISIFINDLYIYTHCSSGILWWTHHSDQGLTGGCIFIYSCSAQQISFEINCNDNWLQKKFVGQKVSVWICPPPQLILQSWL